MGQVLCIQVSPIFIQLLLITLASFSHILIFPAIVSFLGNSGESVTYTSQPIRRDFRAKFFLSSSKKVVELLSFTFTMSNYSYRILSSCNKQLGSHFVLPYETKDGDRALATEDKKSHAVRLVATVLYTSSIKDH